METNKLVAGIVATAIAVIVLAGVLMPALDDSTATSDKFVNEGYFYLQKYTAEDTYTLVWNIATPDTYLVNDEEITFHNDSGLALSTVLGVSFSVRLNPQGTLLNFYGNGSYVTPSQEHPTLTVTYESGTLTVTNGDATKVISSVSEIYSIASKGDYVMKKSGSTAYLNSGSSLIADSEIFASGQSYSGNNNVWWHLEGTIDNIEYPDVFNSNLTVSNETINGSYSNSHNDLYLLNNLTFVITNQSAVDFNITASYFVVPAEVTAERSVQLEPAMSTILNVIPIIIIVAVLLGVVAIFMIRRE